MKQLKFFHEPDTMELRSVVVHSPQSQQSIRSPKPADLIAVLLPLAAFLLWAISLQHVSVYQMNDLGLISVLPPSVYIALIILTVSFCLTLRRPLLRVPILFLHLVLLIFMLFSMTTFMEEAVRFGTVYRHAGYTEYIMRTGSVNPQLDTYFSWPGFFILSAFVTQAAGYHDILQFAAWAPVFFNLIYIGPLYIILTTATTDKRFIWLTLWTFFITNWIGQDYYSPQGLNFFFYLTIIAILVKWFKVQPIAISPFWTSLLGRFGRFTPFAEKLYTWITTPDTLQTPVQPWQRRGLLALLLVIFSFVVFSHPLTPFFTLASVTTLIVLRRCKTWWLSLVMGAMTIAWIVFMGRDFLSGHSSMVLGSIGQIGSSFSANITNRVAQGSSEHLLVAQIRIIMTAVLWLLAFVGGLRRFLKGYHDGTYLLLAVTSFPLIVAQDYGGEMFLRIYLFVLPMMSLFTASLFYRSHHIATRGTAWWTTSASIAINIFLIAGLLITRYGNERVDYKTYDEVAGVIYLYNIAPAHSLLLGAWEDTPWQYRDYEKYDYETLNTSVRDSVVKGDIGAIVSFSQSQQHPVYILFTRSQKASSESFSGLAPGTLDHLLHNLLATNKFKLIYTTRDAQIIVFVPSRKQT